MLLMNVFKGRYFQRDILLRAVRWYCKYGISYRERQEVLAERGVTVDHTTLYRAGTGETLPGSAPDISMKFISKLMAAGLTSTAR